MSLFYQIFEISLQLAILSILVLGYSKLLLVPFFLVSYIRSIAGFLCCLSFICGHIHLLSALGNSFFFLGLLIGTVYIQTLPALTNIKWNWKYMQLPQILIFYVKNLKIFLNHFNKIGKLVLLTNNWVDVPTGFKNNFLHCCNMNKLNYENKTNR